SPKREHIRKGQGIRLSERVLHPYSRALMATSRELKELLRPLLARRPDLALVGRTLFFHPFGHYLRGVAFTTSRFSSISQGYSFWRMAYLLRTLRQSRKEILPLLHDWEAYSVKSQKLTKYWKPTPFPCETDVGRRPRP